MAAEGPGEKRDPFPDVERSRSLRPVHLVGREGQEIDAERPNVHRDLPDRLHGIRMENDASCPRRRGDSAATGWTVPTSLFASMIDATTVSARSAATASAGSKRPFRSTGRKVIGSPGASMCRQGFRTA